MKDIKNYYTTLSSVYDQERSNPYFSFVEAIELECLRNILTPDHKEILEIGCGTGIFLSHLENLGYAPFGLDYNLDMLAHAIPKLNTALLVNGDARTLPYPDSSFDFIYSFKALPHIPELTLALSEIFRVLRPDGAALLEFYNKFSIKRLINRGSYYHCWHSPSDINQLVSDSGLEVIDIHGARIFTPFAGLHSLPGIRSALQTAERIAGKTRLKKLAGYYLVHCKLAQ